MQEQALEAGYAPGLPDERQPLLFDSMVDRKCRICECTDFHACLNDATGETCYWIEEDLCSFCVNLDKIYQEIRKNDKGGGNGPGLL